MCPYKQNHSFYFGLGVSSHSTNENQKKLIILQEIRGKDAHKHVKVEKSESTTQIGKHPPNDVTS